MAQAELTLIAEEQVTGPLDAGGQAVVPTKGPTPDRIEVLVVRGSTAWIQPTRRPVASIRTLRHNRAAPGEDVRRPPNSRLSTFPLPVGVLLEERDGKTLPNSRCVCCNTCDGFPCLVHGKSDAEVLCVRPALELPKPDPAIYPRSRS
jgi:hypothetical protein